MNGQIPQDLNKWNSTAIFEPHHWIEYMKQRGRHPSKSVPKGVIFCYQSSLFQWIKDHHAHELGDGWAQGMMFLSEFDHQIAVTRKFGIGAPAAVTVMEELIGWGVRQFVSVGTAGSLQKDLQVGDLLLCEKSLRDEGASFHYLPPARFANANPKLTEELARALQEREVTFRRGSSWTIDAPYRETKEEVLRYQAEGIGAVEMEAAALFAVAERRGVEIAALLAISDSLADLQWNPQFHSEKTKGGLESLFQAAASVLHSRRS